MKILVVGGGGREHALVWKLAQDSRRPQLFCAPGNAGTAALAENLPLKAEDVAAITAWAGRHRPDLTVVGPEAPLCAGLVDELGKLGLRAFGPGKAAAQIEGSKSFSKEIMLAAGVPTARAAVFTDAAAACAALGSFGLPVVIKASGLAAGKGVVIAATRGDAETAIRSMLLQNVFGSAGKEILIEEFLAGEEASILALVDGKSATLLPTSQDHKRVYDNDTGPNTGGMGAYSPAPVVTEAMLPFIRDTIIMPVVRELARRGITYKGILYAGLMIGESGIRVLEFNARFGDPETQAILPRLQGDIIPLFEACINGTLDKTALRISAEPAATVVLAAAGYPGAYKKGDPVNGLEAAAACRGVTVFHAGTALDKGRVVSSGGRVLAVSATGADLRDAVANAYAGMAAISLKGGHYRRDIAARAMNRLP